MTEEIDLKKLSLPFNAEDIEWRIQSSGKKTNGNVWAKCLAYITSRAIMDRLDDVCGAGNWRNEFSAAPVSGVLCGLSILINGEWVTKWDGSDNSQIEATKGGLSGAMKRAGVQWGIGRYLYKLEAGWAIIAENGKFSAKTKDNTWFNWDAPNLPNWAIPSGDNTTHKGESAPEDKQGQLTCPDFIEKIDNLQQTYEKLTKWDELHFSKAEDALNSTDLKKFRNYIDCRLKDLGHTKDEPKPQFIKCPMNNKQMPIADCAVSGDCNKTCSVYTAAK